MRTNQAGIDLIKQFEGLKLTVYLDEAGKPTVGWGHVVEDWPVGKNVSEDEAEEFFWQDILRTETTLSQLITFPINPNQFAACVSFSFNLGVGNFRSSTLRQCINKGHLSDAAEEFQRWRFIHGKDGIKRESPGLYRRRMAERSLFLEAVPTSATESRGTLNS